MRSIEIFLLLTLFTALLTATVTAQSEDIYEITLNYKKTVTGGTLSLIDIKTAKGTAPDYKLSPVNSYKIEILSSNNEVLKSTNFVVPVGAVLGLSNAKAQGTPNDLTFTISVPYFKDGKLINIYQGSNKVLEIPLKRGTSLIWMYVALPIILIVGYLTFVELKRKKDHQDLMENQRKQNIGLLRNYVTTNLKRGYKN